MWWNNVWILKETNKSLKGENNKAIIAALSMEEISSTPNGRQFYGDDQQPFQNSLSSCNSSFGKIKNKQIW